MENIAGLDDHHAGGAAVGMAVIQPEEGHGTQSNEERRRAGGACVSMRHAERNGATRRPPPLIAAEWTDSLRKVMNGSLGGCSSTKYTRALIGGAVVVAATDTMIHGARS
jgi:hypothetical protein